MENMENQDKLLDINHLCVTYKTEDGIVYAVNDLNLHIGSKETLGFVGETGAGKTTTAMAIMGLLPSPPGKITDGEITFCGKSMIKISDKERRKILGEEISMIFQDPMTSLNPSMRVADQIMEMIRLHKKISKHEAYEEACQLLEMVGIKRERAKDYPHQFSGGMKQRVVIAIALACRPKLIIADEPTTALDVTIQAQIMELIGELQKELDMAMILVTHDLGVVASVADKIQVMYAGKIVEIGTAEEIFYDPRHPYTWGLLQSLPILSRGKEWLPTLPGMPPTLIHPPKGDAFAERNAYAMRIDYEKDPPVFQVTDTHYAATWLLDERAPKVKAPIGERRYGK